MAETIVIDFKVDNTGLKASVDQLQKMGVVTDKEVSSYKKINDELAKKKAAITAATAEANKAAVAIIKEDTALKSTVKSATSLRTQMMEARNEVARLSDLSGGKLTPELIRASKAAASLKDRISDMGKTLDALNPEAKFTAITQVAGGIAGGFAAAQGAMALFGNESEDVQKAILKVQGALALSQGINSVLQLGDAFKNVRILIAASFVATEALTVANTGLAVAEGAAAAGATAFSTALTATGIGAIVVVVGLLIAAIVKYKITVDNITEAQEKFNATLDRNNNTLLAQLDLIANGESRLSKIRREAITDAERNLKVQASIKDNELNTSALSLQIAKQRQQANAQDMREQEALIDIGEVDLRIKGKLGEAREKLLVLSTREKDLSAEVIIATNNYTEAQGKATKAAKDKAEAVAALNQKLFDQALAEGMKQGDIDAATEKKLNDEKIKREQDLSKIFAERALLDATNEREALAEKKNNLKNTYDAAILNAQKTDKDTTVIEEQHVNDIKALAKEEADFKIKEADRVAAEKKKIQEQEKAAEITIINAGFAAAQSLAQTYFNNQATLRQQDLNTQLSALQEQNAADVNHKGISEAKKAEINAKYRLKEKQLKKDAWEKQKQADVTSATIQTALAVITALATVKPTYPAGAAAAIVAGIAGAVQTAQILSQPTPQFKHGTLSVPGKQTNTDSVHAMLMPGEAVIPTHTNISYARTIEAIYKHKISPNVINNFVASKTAGNGSYTGGTAINPYDFKYAMNGMDMNLRNADYLAWKIGTEVKGSGVESKMLNKRLAS